MILNRSPASLHIKRIFLCTFLLCFYTSNSYNAEEGNEPGSATQLKGSSSSNNHDGRDLHTDADRWCHWAAQRFGDLTSEERLSFLTLGFTRQSFNGGVQNINGAATWTDTTTFTTLDASEQNAAGILGFTQDRWNNGTWTDCIRYGPCASPYTCGWDKSLWCNWVNDAFNDQSLEYQLALTVFGFTASSWNNGLTDVDQADIWTGAYSVLNAEEKVAASVLGFTEERWDGGLISECTYTGPCQLCTGDDSDGGDTSSDPCLSGYSQLNVLGKGYTFVKNVEVGDKVLVPNFATNTASDEYQEVYAFGHKDAYAEANFLQIATSHNQEMPLEITGEHLLMKLHSRGDGVPVRADSIGIGDFLIGNKGTAELVTEISMIRRRGLYSPLTRDGKFDANGVVVSSYTAVQEQNPEIFVVGNFGFISHHLLSHAAIAPFRSVCVVLRRFTNLCEQRNEEGQLSFAAEGEKLMSWVMEQPTEIQIVVLTFGLLGLMSFHIMEKFFGSFIMVCLVPLVWLLIQRSINVSSMLKKLRKY